MQTKPLRVLGQLARFIRSAEDRSIAIRAAVALRARSQRAPDGG